jgi:hypothetical protein
MRHLLSLVLLVVPGSALAFERGYLPIPDEALPRPFPLTRVGACPETQDSMAVGKYTLRNDDEAGALTLSGTDKKGKAWEVQGFAGKLGCEVFTADLDKDGALDVIISQATGGTGLAPTTLLTLVRFDLKGRPLPWAVNGRYETSTEPVGIADLVDLDGDGRPELLHMGFDDGYWFTSAYTTTPTGWVQVHGKKGKWSFPLWTRFTKTPNREASRPNKKHHPFEEDRSSHVNLGDAPSPLAELVLPDAAEDKSAKVQQTNDPELGFGGGERCSFKAWNGTGFVVVDRPSGRKATSISATEPFHEVLQAAQQGKWKGRWAGQLRKDVCTPDTVWFEAPDAK